MINKKGFSFFLSLGLFLTLPVFAGTKTTEKQTGGNFVLKPGKVLYTYHTVKPHENLYKIAMKYHKNYYNLLKLNNAKSPYLHIGEKVILGISLQPGSDFNGIVVNIPENKLYHFENGKLEKAYKVAVGLPKKKWQTPLGHYEIIYKSKAPTWKVPVSIQKEMKEKGEKVKKEVPPGPKNPLGKWWMGLTWSGLGIHSTIAPQSIGYSVSHGCIRMRPKSAEELFRQVKEKTPVTIVYQPIKVYEGGGKVYVEAHRDIYHKNINSIKLVKNLLDHYHLDKNIDWKKVTHAVTVKSGEPLLVSK